MGRVDMETSAMPFFSMEEVKLYVLKSVVIEKEKPCVCGACVICINAPKNSSPVHMLKDGKKVEAGGLSELTRKDILMDKPFAGCAAETLMASDEDYRTKAFVENNTYAAIEKAILDRIGVKDKNKDGVKDYKDLEGNDVYKDTYEFLQKLKPYDTTE